MRHTNRLLVSAGMAAGFVAFSTGAAVAADPETNGPDYWETFLEGQGYANVQCDKRDSEGPFTVEVEYLAVILKAGAGEDQNQVIMNPMIGTTYETQGNGKEISHVIYCTGGTSTTTPSTSTTTTTPSTSTTTTTPPTSTTTTPPTSTTSTTTPPTSTTTTPPTSTTSTTTPPTSTTSTTTPPTSTTTTPPTSTTSTTTPPTVPTHPGGPQTPGVVQTDGGPMDGDAGALLGALGIAAFLGTAGAAGVIGSRAAARRH